MRSGAEFRAWAFVALGEWFLNGAKGPCPLHQLVEEETAPACVQCGSNADTCRHAYDDGGLIR